MPFLDAMLMKGIPKLVEDDEDPDAWMYGITKEETEEDRPKYTKEQMESLCCILTTERRNDELAEMREFILQDQAYDGSLFFNTAYNYHIIEMKSWYNNLENWSDMFDLLFAYICTFHRYDK